MVPFAVCLYFVLRNCKIAPMFQTLILAVKMPKWPKNFREQKILKKVVGSFVYLWNTNNLTLPSTQVVLTCEAGIKASHILDIYECLGFKGEKDSILVSHCLLLARYYIYCCKFKNVSPSIRGYVQQLKYNLEIEKQISTVTDSQINFSRSGAKYFMH